MSAAQVLIVGAGPTGLVLALSLARQGVACRIIEKNTGPGQASRAIAVQARTLEFYRQLGIADEVVAGGIRIETIHLREGDEEVARLRFGDLGEGISPFPFVLSYPQDDHERFLVEQLQQVGVSVEWATALETFTQDEAGVSVELVKAGVREQARFDYVCGCDGSHSTVRHGLGIDFPGGTYQQLFYVADVQLRGFDDHSLTANLAEHGLALVLPVRSSGMHRLIGLVPEHLTDPVGLTFEDVRENGERLIGARVEQVNWFSPYRVHHRVASQFRAGRLFLAGDAGHIHSPAGGQGMNTGIGDAVNLAWKLAHVLQGKAAAPVLDTYELERLAFARVLVNTTDRAFQAMAGRSAGSHLLRTWLLPHLLPFLTGFSGVRRAMFNTVAQTRINYHESPLSEGHAGDVPAGDRLPWVPSDDGDNFIPLASLEWQLHVYGEAGESLQAQAARLGLLMQRFPWTDAAEHAGLARDAVYLVRPDGYVALALPHQGPEAEERLARFAERWGLEGRNRKGGETV